MLFSLVFKITDHTVLKLHELSFIKKQKRSILFCMPSNGVTLNMLFQKNLQTTVIQA